MQNYMNDGPLNNRACEELSGDEQMGRGGGSVTRPAERLVCLGPDVGNKCDLILMH